MLPYNKFKHINARVLLFCVMGLRALPGYTQNNTSPYSIIGIGDMEKSSFDRSSGMGHAGVALSSNRFFYHANPASYGSLDDHFFHVEVNSRFQSVSYSGIPISDPTQSSSSDMQFKKLAIAMKMKPRWAVSIGLLPFSTSNYSFQSQKSIQGSNVSIPAYYEGTGSTNQFYIANSFVINKHLSVGIQASYLFGQLDEKESFNFSAADSTLFTDRNIGIGSFYFKYGIQYKTKLNKQWQLGLGATASNKTNLNTDYGLLVKTGNTTLLNNQSYSSYRFSLPSMYTAGIAATLKDAYTFAADYHYEGWAALNITGLSYALQNSNRLSVGFDYSKKASINNFSYEKYFLQSGFFYSDSYLKIYGQQLKNYGLTLGAGTQLKRSGLGLQAAMEIGRNGTTLNGLIRENYTQFSFTISYRDIWFTHMKKYD